MWYDFLLLGPIQSDVSSRPSITPAKYSGLFIFTLLSPCFIHHSIGRVKIVLVWSVKSIMLTVNWGNCLVLSWMIWLVFPTHLAGFYGDPPWWAIMQEKWCVFKWNALNCILKIPIAISCLLVHMCFKSSFAFVACKISWNVFMMEFKRFPIFMEVSAQSCERFRSIHADHVYWINFGHAVRRSLWLCTLW